VPVEPPEANINAKISKRPAVCAAVFAAQTSAKRKDCNNAVFPTRGSHWAANIAKRPVGCGTLIKRGNKPMGTSRLWTLSIFACVGWIVSAAQAQQPALRFKPLAPCRIVDTRNANGPLGGPAIAAQTSRSFPVLTSPCLSGVPSTVAAYSLNVSVIPWSSLGYVTIWPSGQTQPYVSTENSLDGRVKATAAIVPAGTDVNKSVSVWATDTTEVVLDINGYFVPASSDSTALAFFPLTPCRVVDTRNTSGPLGGPWLTALQPRSFPILSGNCNIPTNVSVQAYSLNVSVVPWSTLGYLTLWPTNMPQPFVSTLNAPTGTVTANAAIVPAGSDVNKSISAYATDNTDLIIDINGYFAPSTSGTDLSLYTLPPCRVLDTRLNSTGFVGTFTDDTTASPCGIIPTAQAVVLNASVIPWQHLGYLTLWASGQAQPYVSTLNATDGLITSNMAIVPTSNGVIGAYATDPTDLVLDTTGYFASGTAPAPTTYLLNVAKPGTGNGTVTGLDNKINCGAVCAVSYVSGTVVTLTASADSRSVFGGWSGGGCSGTGSCTVTLTGATTVTATFNGPSISLNSASVGANLERLAQGSLNVAVPSGTTLTVTTTSSDTSKVLLRPYAIDSSGTSAGTASFIGTVAAGSNTTPGFWIQALASSGTAQITVSAPGYQSAVATVTLTPSGFQLNGPAGTGVNFTATLGTPSPPTLTVSAAQLDTSGNVLATNQAVRGGFTASVPVSSGTQATGTIAGSPAVVQAGATTSSAVTFQPNAVGTSVLSITQPSGFSTPATGTQLTVTVALPAISLNPASVGFNLQALGVGQLNQAPSSTLSVTISAAPTGLVLLSTTPTQAGSNSITLTVPAGSISLPPFYIQALASSGTASLTAGANGYSGSTASVVLTGSAFLVSGTGLNGMGVNFATTTVSAATTLTVAIWQLDTSSRPLGSQPGQLRPGISSVSVTVGSGTPSTGTVVSNPAVFNGGDSSNTNLSFLPQNCSTTPCTTVLSVTQPSGFSPPFSGGQLTVTVDKPLVSPLMIVTTIGNNLEVPAAGALDVPAPNCNNSGGLPVKIASNNSNVLLSTSATAAGSSSITVTVPAGSGVNSIGFPTYYVQAKAKSGTATLTASDAGSPACGFRSGTITVTLAPAGFALDGGNGVGQHIGTSTGHNASLTVSGYVLDPTTLVPQLAEAIRGGISPTPSVTVTSSPAGLISGSPVVIGAGSISGTVTVLANSPGTITVTAATPSTPAGFDTPGSKCDTSGTQPCNQLQVFVQ
jgi:Divergent InlB B-repeat domain